MVGGKLHWRPSALHAAEHRQRLDSNCCPRGGDLDSALWCANQSPHRNEGEGPPIGQGRGRDSHFPLNRVSRALAMATAVVVLLLSAYVYLDSGSGGPETSPQLLEHEDEAPPPVAELVDPVPEADELEALTQPTAVERTPADSEPQVESSGRTALEPVISVLHGRVFKENGEPIAGATVSWTAWDPSFWAYVFASVEIPAAVIEAHTTSVESNANGFYTFEEAPTIQPDEKSYLWYSHGAFLAQTIELAAGEEGQEEPRDVTLRAGEPMAAFVSEGKAPVEGAHVVQQMAYPRGSNAPFEGGIHAPCAQLAFLRSVPTDATGHASLASVEFVQRLYAEKEERISSPWMGSHQRQVNLSLLPTFELSGYVEFPDNYDPAWGLPQVRVSRQRASLVEEFASVMVTEGGLFGPAILPVLPADQYKVGLEGAEFVPDEQVLAVPRAGKKVQVEFEGRVGSTLWYLALDQDENPIVTTRARGAWVEQDGRRTVKTASAREDGYVRLSGVAAGPVETTLSAPGYASATFSPVITPEANPVVHQVTLLAGGQLHGRCVLDRAPVPDFEVRYWGIVDPSDRGSVTVVGSTTGEFVVDGLTATQYGVEAIAPGFQRSEVQLIDLASNPEAEALLALQAPASMSGRVVDARTLEPIAGARIEVYSTQGMMEIEPIGDPVLLGADGEFHVERLSPLSNVVSFAAPGYSTRELKVRGSRGHADLGEIELSGQQPLTAKLTLPAGQDPREFLLVAEGVGAIPPTHFDADGRLRIEQANEGAFVFRVLVPDAAEAYFLRRWQWLRLGEEWHLEFETTEGRGLVVEASGLPPRELVRYVADISYPTLNGQREETRAMLDDKGQAHLRGGIGVGAVIVRIMHIYGENLIGGAVQLEVTEFSPHELRMEVPLAEHSTRVRVLDTKGQPMGSTRILLRASQQGGTIVSSGVTNAAGECAFRALPETVDSATLVGPSGGTNDAVPCDLTEAAGGWVELVFDLSASINLSLHDGGAAQSAITCRLWSLQNDYAVCTGRTPDAAGQVNLGEMGPGAYELRTDGPGHWPVVMEVEARSPASSYSVEVRRLASLTLTVVDSEGTARGQQTISLQHVDLGESVEDWLAQGLLASSAGSTLTDGTGKLSLTGVPHGEYRWHCNSASGMLTLLPGEMNEQQIVIP